LELLNCRRWWLKEFVLIKPRIVLLVGGPAAECFEIACGGNRSFGKLLTSQGEILTLERVTVKRFVVPHPASRYRDKGKLYQEVIDLMGAALRA
jgi:uracil-DNA glycosylase